MPDLPGALHGMACSSFIVLQAAKQGSPGTLTTAASSPIILAKLAFSIADVLLVDWIAQQLERMDCPEFVEACLNFGYLHTFAQLPRF
ncbi:unnamed protein product [Dibothriocephalus latus]|uniref:Uncharacterized protein n=1 Tax=Dibothriocephalus latus TaxID=60516 RepID=A0A3P7LWH6_DIBLA|nr:unnamed protein product [Dibothriocephalus latus]